VATLCAAGLRTEGVFRDYEYIGVFRPTMVALASRLGLIYTSFERAPDGSWVKAS
jgi:hypothetical protein